MGANGHEIVLRPSRAHVYSSGCSLDTFAQPRSMQAACNVVRDQVRLHE